MEIDGKTVPRHIRVRPDSFRAWLLAARPKTLTGAAVPVMVGCALAWSDSDVSAVGVRIGTGVAAAAVTGGDIMVNTALGFVLPAVLCFLFAFLMQIDANLINDLWDYLKGSDREDRLGPERACSQGWITPRVMRRGIVLTTVAACAVGCGLLFYGGWWLVAVGMACVVFAFLYTAGPYPLAYHGWGDLLVLLFFGFIPVGCTYYVLTGSWNVTVGLVSAVCGLVIDTLLMVNNYRDMMQDVRSGKLTLVVRLGKRAGERLYLILGVSAALLCVPLLFEGRIYAAVFPLLYIVPHVITWRCMVRIGKGRELNLILGETSRNIFLFGLLLTVGLLL